MILSKFFSTKETNESDSPKPSESRAMEKEIIERVLEIIKKIPIDQWTYFGHSFSQEIKIKINKISICLTKHLNTDGKFRNFRAQIDFVDIGYGDDPYENQIENCIMPNYLNEELNILFRNIKQSSFEHKLKTKLSTLNLVNQRIESFLNEKETT